jgi:transposase
MMPLSDDPAELKALLRAAWAQKAAAETALAAAQQSLAQERAAHAQTTERLRQTEFERDLTKFKMKALLRRYFGRSSEKLDEGQLKMAWAAVEADLQADESAPKPPPKPPRPPRTKSQRRQRRLEDLPVQTEIIDVPAEEQFAPDGTPLVKIREEVTEEVDYEPGRLFRRRIVRPIYASPAKNCAPVIADLPARVIPGGQVGPGLIAHVLMSKYVDALPLYRQAVMLDRLGPAFSRQAMGEWVEHGATLLMSIHRHHYGLVQQHRYLMGDETPIRVLDPARPGVAREAWLWTFLAPELGVVVFDFQLTRSHEPALAFLRRFQGVFQSDGYGGYTKALGELPKEVRAGIIHANCMAHARRGYVTALESGDERAAPFLGHIGRLYAIEDEFRGADPPTRSTARQERSVPWLARFRAELDRADADPAILPKSALYKAVHYCLDRWDALTRFAQPGFGHVQIDSNAVERAIRPSAVGKKNYLFVGHPSAGWRSAVIYSVLGTCALQGVNPWKYLTWVLPKLAAATTKTDIGELTPRRFAELNR